VGPTGLRAQKKQLTRDALVAAALDLFEQRGYEETTIEDIAEAVHVSPRTFFRYFDSKVELVLDLDHDHHRDDEKSQRLLARPAHEAPLDACYHVMLDGLRNELGAATELHVRKFRIVMQTPSLRSLALEHFRSGQHGLVRAFALRLGLDEDALAPRVLAAAISEAMLAIVERWVQDGARLDGLHPLVDEAFDALRAGFGGAGARPSVP
jgi:AcrR family transcriptional regulator